MTAMSVFEEQDRNALAEEDELDVAQAQASPQPAETFWTRLRRLLFGPALAGDGQPEVRIHTLTRAIEAAPDSAANYVLRGELYLELGEYGRATADFRQALELAAQQFETADWGLVAQALQDRARCGLQEAQRRQLRQRGEKANEDN
jgi:tetratricopeptide (TPR) repeat protein